MTPPEDQAVPPDVAMRTAIDHHLAGLLPEAEKLYRFVLQALPGHADANHNLGLLAVQIGQPLAALPYLKAALSVKPAQGLYALSYAEALLATDQAGEALAVIEAAMARGFDTPEAKSLRGKAEVAARGKSKSEGSGTAEPSIAAPGEFGGVRMSEGLNGKGGGSSKVVQRGKKHLSKGRLSAKFLPPFERRLLADLLNSGQYVELESNARRLLERYQDSGAVWKALSAALRAQGKAALVALQQTAKLLPGDAVVHSSLGNALSDLGRFEDAAVSYRRALEINPIGADVYNDLGCALMGLGLRDDAVVSFRKALAISPGFLQAYNNLGNVLRNLGKLDEAVACFRRAIEIRADFAEGHNALGNVQRDLGLLDDAMASYRRALETKPNYADAFSNLGIALSDLGKFNEALTCYHRALEIRPDFVEAYLNLGNAQRTVGQFGEALDSLCRALEIKADFAAAHSSLGFVLSDLGRLDEALACYYRALEIKPDLVDAHINLGNALRDLGRLNEALASHSRALEINAESVEAHCNLGNVLTDLGRHDEAVLSLRRALEIRPDYAANHSNLLFGLSLDGTVDAQTLFAEHCRFGERFELPLRGAWPQHVNSRDPERCLQVGFVSGDFRNHAVAFFIEPLLAQLAGYPQLSLHAYSNHAVEDVVTQRLKTHFAHWHQVTGMSDEALAQKISDDGIDILIDLSGHTAFNRLLCFARKPAPVQASWLGYPGTTGLVAMDYFLAERHWLPPGKLDSQFTEKIIQMPATSPFLPPDDAPPVNALPALGNGYLTFGSFNRSNKLSRSVIALWSQLLHALPDSRLVLGGLPAEGSFEALIESFAQEGVASDRLDFYARCDLNSYLSLHQQVDICLDTFPYNGGTTTFYALWMGVPTLSLAGNTAASRCGASVLGQAGLAAFVAQDAVDFVERGRAWAADLAGLAVVRAGLREQFLRAVVGQPALVAEGVQRTLRLIWQRWCAGLPAESFEVSLESVSKAQCRQGGIQ